MRTANHPDINRRARPAAVLALLLALLAAIAGAPGPARAIAGNPAVVISQVYGGGGNSGAPLANDYVELFNRSAAPVSLSGLSIQYASATGTGAFGSNPVVPLSGTLAPGQRYLVQLAGGVAGSPLPAPDATGTINASASAGKFALVNGTAGLACNGGSAPCSQTQLDQIIDLVGYGSANFFEGSGPAPALSNTTAGIRAAGGCQDTNNNAADFSAGTPAPRNSAAHATPCADAAPAVASTSPANGATGVPLNANITVTFSEPVAASAGAFTLACATSGSHTLAVSGGPQSFTLDPAPDFAAGESCTVTVAAAQISDLDTDDPPDTMAADYTFGFSAAASSPAATIRIHDIQGAGHISPLVSTVNDNSISLGASVAAVPGIVTAVGANGFWMQDPEADANPATSEGIFVFTGASGAKPAVGDSVTVTGRAAEFRPGCTSTSCTASSSGWNNLTTTEITGASGSPLSWTLVSSGNPLPAPTVIGVGGRIPPTATIEDDTNGSIETTPNTFDPENDGIDFYESLEGMRVQVNDALVTGPTNNFGEITVLPDNGAFATSRTARGGALIGDTYSDFNPERLQIDDTLTSGPPKVNVGDRFPGAIIGVLDYSFGNYELLNTAPLPAPASGGLAREVVGFPPPNAAQLNVTSFNVENLDPNDPQSKFDGLAAVIVNNLGAPDLLGVEEVQDNNGPTNDSVVDADQTFAKLIAAIQAAGGPTYSYRQINPVDDQDGGEPGGNIRVGFLFRSDRGLAFVDRPGGTPTAAVSVVAGAAGPELSFSPGRIDPTNSAFNNSRKPLAGEFTFNGQKLFAIVNHFNSKGGDQPLYGRFQPPARASETQRHQQAQIVNNFVDSLLAQDANANVVVLGDLNDFEFSETLNILKGGVLTDLIETLPKAERYTYTFEGNAQVLDHVLVSGALFGRLVGYDVVHINAEFAEQTSDHDPSVARFTLGTAPQIVSLPLVSATQGQAYSYDVDATGAPAAAYSLDTAPDGMTIDAPTGLITWPVNVLPGSYPVVVRASNGVAPDAVQSFSITVAAAPAAGKISPVLECVAYNGGSSYTARFGYKNPNTFPVQILIGPGNNFTPAPPDRGQPTLFAAGRQRFVFDVPFNGSNLVWTLNGKTATASSNPAQRCP
jgi:predicted extracellular nuclease